MAFGSIPVTGLDGSGNPVTLMTKTDGKVIVAGNAGAIGSVSTEWTKTVVRNLFHSSAGTVAIGYGTDPLGQNKSLVWSNQGSGWVIGEAVLSQIRQTGIEYHSGDWLVADGTNVYGTTFKMSAPGPAGGFAVNPPVYTPLSKTSIPVDSLNATAGMVIGTAMGTTGSWTESTQVEGVWDHNVGIASPVSTGQKKTTYTFPGYTATNKQVQYANAVPNGDSVPTQWNTATGSEEGYYGINGAPVVSITWSPLA